ncbi:MAG: sensor histidine kinase [Bacillota bacterium]
MGPGTVKIFGEVKARELRITISDNGVGIPRNVLPMILTPGYGSGNGVGLSNVHERFKSLYGENYGLLIQSREGTGTWITLRVPLLPFYLENLHCQCTLGCTISSLQ